MFGLGLSEIFFIVILFLVFVKPCDLPKTLRKLGYYRGVLKRHMSEAHDLFEEVCESDGGEDDAVLKEVSGNNAEGKVPKKDP